MKGVNLMAVQFTYVKNTNNNYIILNTGKIFSKFTCDYITPYTNKNGTIFYKLRYVDGVRVVSINSLLEEHF